jgi:hypothetical protein
MKYIFIVGAPGSKWSSVAKNIYFSRDIDRTDASPVREYWHSAWGEPQLMHLGAYFDPGMEFGRNFARMDQYSQWYNEQEFDRPFSGTGVRIIKSHVFAHHIDYLKKTWPESPVVLVERGDDACLGWWVKCGHFGITYPDYAEYYQNLPRMAQRIHDQNMGIRRALETYPGQTINTNVALAAWLKLAPPPEQYFQNYAASDIKVKVI